MALPHITIPPNRTAFGYGVGATPQSQFVIPWPFFAPTDITVEIPTGSGHLLTYGTEYVVFPTAGFSYGFPGGVLALTTPVTNTGVLIRRTLPFQRVTDFPDSGPIQTGVLNLEFDKLVAMIQQLSTTDFELDLRLDALELGDPRIGRALLFPVGDPSNKSLPDIGNRADQLLGFRFDGQIQMRSGLIVPDSPRNMELPLAASRANRVLGFDAVGNINLVDVTPPAQIIPNAGNIDYRAFDSGLVRSVQERLRERISIKDFGAGVGQGNQAADDAALLAAVNYINAQTGTTALTLYYPDGTYFHGPCPQALTRGRFTIAGTSPSGTVIYFLGPGTWLQVHGPTVIPALLDNVAIGNIHLEGGLSAGTFKILSLRRTFGVLIQNVTWTGMDTLVDLGVKTDSTQGAFRTTIRDCSGVSRNEGVPLININWVSGLTISNVNALANTGGGPGALDGTNAVRCDQTGFSTQVMITNTVFEAFARAVFITSGAGEGSSDWSIQSSSFPNCKNNAIALSTVTGGIIQGFRVSDCWLDSTVGNTVAINGPAGTIHDGHMFTGNRFNRGGTANFFLGLKAQNITLSCNQFGQSNLATGGQAAIHIAGGAGGISIVDNSTLNPTDSSMAAWGIQFDALTTDYQCSLNRMRGVTGGIRAIPDAAVNDKTRRIHNNSHANVPGGYAESIVQLTLDVNGDYLNQTPFVQTMQVTGGQVSGVQLNTVNYPQALPTQPDQFRGDYILQPGDFIRVNNTVTPFVTIRNMA